MGILQTAPEIRKRRKGRYRALGTPAGGETVGNVVPAPALRR